MARAAARSAAAWAVERATASATSWPTVAASATRSNCGRASGEIGSPPPPAAVGAGRVPVLSATLRLPRLRVAGRCAPPVAPTPPVAEGGWAVRPPAAPAFGVAAAAAEALALACFLGGMFALVLS